jgi:hypothetical protein
LEEERAKREAAAAAAKATSTEDFGVENPPAPPPARRGTPSARSTSRGSARSSSKASGPVARRSGGSGSGSGSGVATPTIMSRAMIVLRNLRVLVDEVAAAFRMNPYVVMRMLAFVMGLLLLLSRKKVRERVAKVIGVAWAKVKATAGMGTKVSYI